MGCQEMSPPHSVGDRLFSATDDPARASTQAILALLIVGSFVNVMVLGAPVLNEHYDKVIAALSALTGSIIGFYFAARTATTPPNGATNASTKAAGDSATEHTQ